MGLLDNIMGAAQREQRGLFDVSGMGNFPPAQIAEAPQQEKRGGVFGSDYSGEDLITMLLRAAAIAQGDYGSAAQLGSNIGAKARAEAEAAYKRQAEREDWQWKQDYTRDNQGPTNKYREYIDAGYSPEQARAQMQADAASARQKIISTPEGGQAGTWEPSAGYKPIVLPNEGGAPSGSPAGGVSEGQTATNPQTGEKVQFRGGQWVPVGGGASNGTGGFRP